MSTVRKTVTPPFVSTTGLPHPSIVEVREEQMTPALEEASEISQALGISLITARILTGRGVKEVEHARAFLFPTLKEHLPDPSKIKNITQAADLILDVVERGDRITVYHDFDVDGVSGGSQLVLFLRALGGVVSNYTPNRFSEGYGLVLPAVEHLARGDTKLLITVDCGISSVHEIKAAKRFGMQVVVVDHHEALELPPADVVVDPAQDGCPFQEHRLAAAGLVWMLLVVLRARAQVRWREQLEEGKVRVPEPKSFLELAALGTICDMVPLTGVNRVLASRGVEALRRTSNPGLVALKRVAKIGEEKRISAGHVGFGLGPRINAAGRLGDAQDAFDLLTTSDTTRATRIASAIDRLNSTRRGVEEEVRLSCLSQLEEDSILLEKPALALYGEEYHLGVIGIVAQRLVELFYRPVAVMAPGTVQIGGVDKPVVKGSVRSIKGFHVACALQAVSEFLIGHGGHAQAGGFTVAIEKLEEFKTAFVNYAAEVLSPELLVRTRVADIAVSLSELDFKLATELGTLAPFGTGNPSPLLVSRAVEVTSVSPIGSRHLRLRFAERSFHIGGVAWGFRGHPLLRKGHRLNIAYHPEINTYQGVSSVQLNLKEVWQ